MIRIRGEADNGHGMVNGDEVGGGNDLRGLKAVAKSTGTDDGAFLNGNRSGVFIRKKRRIGSVRGVTDHAVGGNIQRHAAVPFKRPGKDAAGGQEFRGVGIADKPVAVGLAGGGSTVIKQAALSERASVGGVIIELRNDDTVQDGSIRGGQGHGFTGLP